LEDSIKICLKNDGQGGEHEEGANYAEDNNFVQTSNEIDQNEGQGQQQNPLLLRQLDGKTFVENLAKIELINYNLIFGCRKSNLKFKIFFRKNGSKKF
jgi:hypothetical protein